MTETGALPDGLPSWVDLASPDTAGAAAFYGELFGWTVADQGAEAGGYRMFLKDGKTVGGLGPVTMDGQPTAWTPYIAVASADQAEERARDAGGLVHVEPVDVTDAGRMAVFADSDGAAFGVWQAGSRAGFELQGVTGSVCWLELWSRDPDGASVFYSEVFGWEPHQSEMESMSSYVEWSVEDRTFAGMLAMPEGVPDEIPPHWVVYFAVEDADAAVARTEERGGRTLVPATDIPPGRFAVLADPYGAAFAVLQPAVD
jgi:predicted enzyme related to lactoylglutathione lyase